MFLPSAGCMGLRGGIATLTMTITLRIKDGHWAGSTFIRRRAIALNAALSASMPRAEALAACELAIGIVVKQERRILDAAVKELRPLYNEDWRAERAKKLGVAAFRGRLKLRSITPCELDNPSFLVTVHLDPGDLFAGHSIEVMLERDGTLLGKPHLIG
jgi:hypothetical protein